jgi:hypothetical protein
VRGADGVLELPAGTIERSGTQVGDRVTMDPIRPGARAAQDAVGTGTDLG